MSLLLGGCKFVRHSGMILFVVGSVVVMGTRHPAKVADTGSSPVRSTSKYRVILGAATRGDTPKLPRYHEGRRGLDWSQ